MRFSVSVPVLSEQMAVTEPSVSTAGSLRIRALRRTMRCAPRARAMVTTAGRPSGTAATARLTAVRNISLTSLAAPDAHEQRRCATSTSAPMASHLPSSAMRRCSGVLFLGYCLEHVGDVAQLGLHARLDHDAVPRP